MRTHTPQLTLRLDAAATDADAPWRAGGAIVYLGAPLRLVLDTACRAPERVAGELHLPLPPGAAARQIRDAAESWLRDEALRIFTEKSALGRPEPTPPPWEAASRGCERGGPTKSALAGRRLRVVLSFGKRGDWVKREGALLRCHWRLIEQPRATIEQVLERALAEIPPTAEIDDLFALV